MLRRFMHSGIALGFSLILGATACTSDLFGGGGGGGGTNNNDGGGGGGGGGGGNIPGGDDLTKPGTITITPNPVEVTIDGTADQRLDLTAVSDSLGDISKKAAWTLSDPGLASVAGGTFVAKKDTTRGGSATITVRFGVQSATAPARVKLVRKDVLGTGAPADAPSQYGGAGTSPNKPAWVYPLTGAMLPKNHPEMNFQWNGVAGAESYRVTVEGPTFKQNFFVGPAACPAMKCQLPAPDADWLSLARSLAGQEGTITVAAGSKAGLLSQDSLNIHFSPEDVRGGLYYWSTTITGIYRVPIGARTPQIFMSPQTQGNSYGCVGCHAVSRDGKKVAMEFGSANGIGGGVVDGEDPSKYLVRPSNSLQWNLQTFSPKGDLLLVNWYQAGQVINADTGAKVADFPGKLAQPEWSPDGKNIVYVDYPADGSGDEWFANNIGHLTTIPWNDGNFGEKKQILASEQGKSYNFYPSWTPDSRWIVFNRCMPNCNTYDAANTSLWLMKAEPGAKPIKLTKAMWRENSNTNWPRVAPFVQKGKFIFFTFSAKYPYGFVKTGSNPQMWMAAVDLEKAEKSPDEDPSYAPFWLTVQKTNESNHLGSWTTEVACKTDASCPPDFQCLGGTCVSRQKQ